MKKILKDVIDHTYKLGNVEKIKIVGTNDENIISCVAENNTIAVMGKLNEVDNDLQGTFCMDSLPLVSGLLSNSLFNSEKADIKVVRRSRNGAEVPEELKFISEDGVTGSYRMLAPEVMDKELTLRIPTWEVSIKPTSEKLAEIRSIFSLYNSFEPIVTVSTVEDEEGCNILTMFIGDEGSASHKASVALGKVDGSLTNGLRWNISTILSVFKVTSNDDVMFQFSNRGAFKIVAKNDVASYDFIILAHKG